MGEFLEYIRQQHYKNVGAPKPPKVKLSKGKILEFDSLSEITDLSQQEILTTSMHLLSKTE